MGACWADPSRARHPPRFLISLAVLVAGFAGPSPAGPVQRGQLPFLRVKVPPTEESSCFRNGPLRVNPPFPSRRRLLASVRGRRAGRHLMWSEGRESPSVVRSVGAATTGPASSHPPSRRRDLGDQACRDLFDPLLFR